MQETFDLIIVGAGAAGFAAAMKANELKAKTLLINNNAVGLGGTCVNVGCLPTKHLLYIAEQLHLANNLPFKGMNGKASIDFSTIINEKDKLVEKLRNKKYVEVLESLPNVTFIEGQARLVSQTEIQVNAEKFKGQKFVVAAGSQTLIPQIQGMDKIDYLTNIEALSLKKQPKSMIVLGGGALGVEFAQLFSRFGTKVCLLQRADRLVPREEPELAKLLQQYLEEVGIEICTNVEIENIEQQKIQKTVNAVVNGKKKSYKAEALLVATGRKPNTQNLGLEKIGVKIDKRGGITVNEEMRASLENFWAAGDVKGEPMLETIAAKEGAIATNNALTNEKKKMDYSIVPHAVFTSPQLAGVGLTDEQAVQNGVKCRCNTVPFEMVPKSQAIKNTKGAIKMVIDNETKTIIGIHILAPEAADLIHEATMIIKNKMTIYDVIDTLHVFPTLSEAIKIVAQSFVRDVSKMSCCVE
ncbi:MAG: mercury(II) reductase [Candidatus Diapherotrites archaeon]|nr:mercury(II) reductase [Candidatus Diapherotrites archaeon]